MILQHEFYSLVRAAAYSKNIGYVYRLYVKRHQDNPKTPRILPLPTVLKFQDAPYSENKNHVLQVK